MSDQQVVDYLKSSGLWGTFEQAAGVAKEAPSVGDVHAPTALGNDGKPKPKKTTTIVTTVTDTTPQPALVDEVSGASDVDKVLIDLDAEIAKRDVVFSKGDANLYAFRPLTTGSAQRLHDWAAEQGIQNLVPPELMHTTQIHSTAPVSDTIKPLDTLLDIPPEGRHLSPLGKDGKAIVMHFMSPQMQARHDEAKAAGATWDFPSFLPHVTLSYDGGDQAQYAGMIQPPDMPLQLGPEQFQDSNDDWVAENGLAKMDIWIDVEKTVDDQQVIFGWASVSSVNGETIIDKQDDAIFIEDLEPAVYDYVLYSREQGDMHEKRDVGKLIESIIFTPEKAACGLIAKNDKGEQIYGWWVGYKVNDPGTWAAHKRGERPEFSIGGKAVPVPLP